MPSISSTTWRSARCLLSGTSSTRKPLSLNRLPPCRRLNSDLAEAQTKPLTIPTTRKPRMTDAEPTPEEIEQLVDLAKTLPESLITFFRRFPPGKTYATGPQRPEPPQGTPTANEILLASTPISDPTYNPFQTWKNPITGRWRPPMFSLRRQAELVRKAVSYGVADLLPFTNKLPWVKVQKREEQGLRVKGTGVGQKVKGKEWERTVKGRLEKRRKAMLEMPKLVQQWKEVSFDDICLWSGISANLLTERTWSWVEEMAEVIRGVICSLPLNFWGNGCCCGWRRFANVPY